MKILVIEDDKGLSNQLCGLLNDYGYETFSALDEKEAIGLITEEYRNISIAIVDMFLPPKGKDLDFKESGLRIVKFIEEKYPTIISIVHTGNADHNIAALCIEAGAFSYIEKGGDPKLLMETIKRADSKYCQVKDNRDAIYSLKNDLNKAQILIQDIMGKVERINDQFR